MSKLMQSSVSDFTGGLNLRTDAFQLGRNESPNLLNVDVDPRGGLTVRGGMTKFNTSAIGSIANGSAVTKNVFFWEGNTPRCVVGMNNGIYHSSGGAFSSFAITTDAPDGPSFATWNAANVSNLYVAIGTLESKKIVGTTVTALTDPTGSYNEDFASPTTGEMPRAQFCAIYANMLWCANTTETATSMPNRLRFSHPLNIESWRALDFIDIPDGGDGITAMCVFNGSLLIFKKHSVWSITGDTAETFILTNLTNRIGAVNSLSVAVTESAIYFFSWAQGLYKFNGQAFEDIFGSIRPILQDGTVHQHAQSVIRVTVIDGRIWVGLPRNNDTTITENYIYDESINDGAWTRYQTSDGRGVGSGGQFVGSSGQTFLFAAHASNAYILKVDQPNVTQDDVGTGLSNFDSFYTTKWYDADNISAKKMWRRPDLIMKRVSVDSSTLVEVYHNWTEGLIKRSFTIEVVGIGDSLMWRAIGVEPDAYDGWNEADWGLSPDGSIFVQGKNLGLSRSLQMVFRGVAGKPWGLNSITYKFNPRKVRA
jgi:hypothetical protein